MDINHYLGLPGNTRALQWPRQYSRPRARQTQTFVTATGRVRVGRLLNAARSWSLPYVGLTRANFTWLEAIDQGHMGPGPFVFLDPATRNHLTVNQSSACSAAGDTRDFTVAGTGGTITVETVPTMPWEMPYQLRWSFATSTPGTSTLTLNEPSTLSTWFGFPLVARAYTFWFRAVGVAGDATVGLTPTLTWFDTSGAQISSTAGATVNTSSLQTKLSVTATPPATAAFMQPSIAASSATITAGDAIDLYSFNLHEGLTPDARWTPGTGIYPVQVISHAEQVPWLHPELRVGNTLVLQEVTP
jgi:hypothetical protein